MISKELLSLVLDEDWDAIGHIVDIGSSDNSIFVSIELDGLIKRKEINLDTLGRLCKEWCLKHKYYVVSYLTFIGASGRLVNINDTIDIVLTTKTELEAVIKATEWVAKEKGLL